MNKLFLLVFFSCLFIGLGTKASAASNTILINEIFYDPAGSDLGSEWIEIYNSSSAPINLSGWQLQIAGSSFVNIFTLPNGTTIGANSYLTVGETNTTANIKVAALAFQNGGTATDGIRLVNTTAQVIDTVLYDDDNTSNLPDDSGLAGSKFAIDVASGYSLCRKDTSDTDDSSVDFITCTQTTIGALNVLPHAPEAKIIAPVRVFLNQEAVVFGAESSSPNGDIIEWFWEISDKSYADANPFIKFIAEGQNSLKLTVKDEIGLTNETSVEILVEKFSLTKYKDLIISEVFPSPTDFDANKDGTADTNDEFIELTNTGNTSINLSGLQLADLSTIEEPAFTFTDVTLGPKEVLVLFKDTTKLTLNNDEDTVYLLGPEGETISKLAFSKLKSDQSANQDRYNIFVATEATPGIFQQSGRLAGTGRKHPFLEVLRTLFGFYISQKYAMLGVSNLVYTKVKWLQENQNHPQLKQQNHEPLKHKKRLHQRQVLQRKQMHKQQ